jgi:hypothetical protein
MYNTHVTQMLGLVIISAWAIAGTRGAKGRVLALLIILASMAGGLGVGLLIGLRENPVVRCQLPINLIILCGAFSGIYRIYRNRVGSGKSWPAT